MQSNHLYKTIMGAVLLIVIILLPRCNYRETTMGYQHRIFVVADSVLWQEIKDEVLSTFEAEVFTPGTETSFNVDHIPLDKLNGFKSRMNIFMVGLENRKTETDEYMRSFLPEEFKQGVSENKYFYVFQDDMFARDQIGLIMYAKDLAGFKENFAANKEKMFETFEDKYYARLKKSMYEKGEQNEISDLIAEKYGWRVRVQHDYFVAVQDIEKDYVWLRRIDPDRWLSVWRVKADSSILNKDSLFDIRDRITKEFYQGDTVVREDTELKQVGFNGKRTYKMIGVWVNDSLGFGGPFRTYVVNEPDPETFYFIDMAVMAPGKMKKPFLDQLEAMARTFEIVSQPE